MRAFCRMFHVKHSCGPTRPHVPPKQVFDRAVLSECLSESEHVREDKETVFNSAVRVPCNARLKCRRRPARLRRCVRHCLRMFQLYVHRPREGCLHVPARSVCNLHKRAKRVNRFSIQARASPSIPAQRAERSHTKNSNPAPHIPRGGFIKQKNPSERTDPF